MKTIFLTIRNKQPLALILCFALLSTGGFSQKKQRLQPGQMYEPGATVLAPRLGFESKIPEGWQGSLPRETETFLLSPVKSVSGTIYVWGAENDNAEALKKRWVKGVDMGDGIRLKALGPIQQRGEVIAAEGELSGSTNVGTRKIYAEAKCSGYGICITYILVTEKNFYEAVQKDLQYFVDNTSLKEPSNVSIYENFDWKEFLNDKMLITYESNQDYKKENEVHLCSDGTFKSSIKRRGLLKEEAKAYQGNKSGKWSVAPGQQTKLILTFAKTDQAVEIDLLIQDEKVYANGTRHFVAYSDRCNKNK